MVRSTAAAFALMTLLGRVVTAQTEQPINDQPQLSAVKIDFIPGEKTLFYDDFTDTAHDEPPAHWKLRDGALELRTGSGIHQMTGVCPVKVSMSSAPFKFPSNFTTEIEAAFGGESPSIIFFAWPKGVDGGMMPTWKIDISPTAVSMTGPKDELIGRIEIKPPSVDKPIRIALWVQDGRARGYVNGDGSQM